MLVIERMYDSIEIITFPKASNRGLDSRKILFT